MSLPFSAGTGVFLFRLILLDIGRTDICFDVTRPRKLYLPKFRYIYNTQLCCSVAANLLGVGMFEPELYLLPKGVSTATTVDSMLCVVSSGRSGRLKKMPASCITFVPMGRQTPIASPSHAACVLSNPQEIGPNTDPPPHACCGRRQVGILCFRPIT